MDKKNVILITEFLTEIYYVYLYFLTRNICNAKFRIKKFIEIKNHLISAIWNKEKMFQFSMESMEGHSLLVDYTTFDLVMGVVQLVWVLLNGVRPAGTWYNTQHSQSQCVREHERSFVWQLVVVTNNLRLERPAEILIPVRGTWYQRLPALSCLAIW